MLENTHHVGIRSLQGGRFEHNPQNPKLVSRGCAKCGLLSSTWYTGYHQNTKKTIEISIRRRSKFLLSLTGIFMSLHLIHAPRFRTLLTWSRRSGLNLDRLRRPAVWSSPPREKVVIEEGGGLASALRFALREAGESGFMFAVSCVQWRTSRQKKMDG